MAGSDALTKEVKDLIEAIKPQNEAVLDMMFKVNILWKVFCWGCGVVGVALLSAVIALVLKG